MPNLPRTSCAPDVIVKDLRPDEPLILASPFISSLVFENEASDARDHCANERNFLSWLRLSIYMCIVSVAIILSFQLKSEPSTAERRMALPLGLIFWALSLVCLGAGLANYLQTIQKYSRRAALVQSGTKTQAVFFVVSIAIVGACVIFITTNAQR
ncbi:hypothetical protein FN846DRAFT_945649 [Sphaerosporella brunnea]|uniref:DUF202 domain-containing protein n=1 Tax=Sphaerosporella brunnea TaxID=1250544 RepID=A0A5J5EYZ4_9PEZI|nr:hypothetical protein FN846DRAFT_945649 [Sphaerosporella brunnea]